MFVEAVGWGALAASSLILGAVFADADGDRLHRAGARRRAVAGNVLVQVPAPQAARTVISMHGAGRVERYVQPAVAAAERAVTAPGARYARQAGTSYERERNGCYAGCSVATLIGLAHRLQGA